MTNPLPADIGARIRAARGYGGDLSRKYVEQRTGISEATLARTESGEREPKPAELWALAEVCGVGRKWFTAEPPTVAGPLDALENRLEEALRVLRSLRAGVAAVEGQAASTLPALTGSPEDGGEIAAAAERAKAAIEDEGDAPAADAPSRR